MLHICIYIYRERVKSSPSFSNKKRIASACFGHLQLFKEIKRLKFLSRKCCSKVPTISLMTSTCLGWFGIQQAYPSLPSGAESPGQAKVRLMSAYAMYASMNLPIYEYLLVYRCKHVISHLTSANQVKNKAILEKSISTLTCLTYTHISVWNRTITRTHNRKK